MAPIPVPQALLDFIREGTRFIVAGHKEPDGDCVGSQLALTSALSRMGKTAIPCSAGPFKRPEIVSFEKDFIQILPDDLKHGTRVLIMDCSSPERTGSLAPFLEGIPTATIDHHATGHPYGDVFFLDPFAPSVTFMTLAVIEALGLEPTRHEAELLFFGLCTDTGFFRHVDDQGGAVFEYAARMVHAGASPKAAFQAINGGKSLDSRILLGLILARSTAYFEGKLIVSYELLEDTERYGLQGRDSDNLYQLLQSVVGVEAVVIIRQETPDNCTVGLRSREGVDVSAIAAQFGGGGHKQASGFSFPGTIEPIRQQLLRAFNEVL